jgi:hypothetical protein
VLNLIVVFFFYTYVSVLGTVSILQLIAVFTSLLVKMTVYLLCENGKKYLMQDLH